MVPIELMCKHSWELAVGQAKGCQKLRKQSTASALSTDLSPAAAQIKRLVTAA